MTHEVQMLCNCENIDACRTEIYVSDVRIAQAEIERLRALVDERLGEHR